MSDPVCTLGDLALNIFAGKAASRLPSGTDTLAVMNMRDVDTSLTPRAGLEIQQDVDAEALARLAIETGDIIMTSRGTIRAGVALAEHVGAIPGANTVVIRLRPKLPPRVLASYLTYPRTVAALLREFVGSTTAGFSVAGLAKLAINLPDQATLEHMDAMMDAVERYVIATTQAAQARQGIAIELVARTLQPGEAQ